MIDDKTKLAMIDKMIIDYYELGGGIDAEREAGMLDQLISDISAIIRFGEEEKQ